MNFFKEILLLDRIHCLIKRKSTGSPSELATRLGISERGVYRIIRILREEEFPIEYDRLNETYYYSKDVHIEIKIRVDNSDLSRFIGGNDKLYRSYLAPFLYGRSGTSLEQNSIDLLEISYAKLFNLLNYEDNFNTAKIDSE